MTVRPTDGKTNTVTCRVHSIQNVHTKSLSQKIDFEKVFWRNLFKVWEFQTFAYFSTSSKISFGFFPRGGGKSHQYTMSEIHFELMTQRLQKASYFKLWKGKIDTRHCYDHSITLILMKLGNINSWICEIKNTRGIFDILFSPLLISMKFRAKLL